MPHKDPDARRAYQREYQRKWARENREKRLEYERSWNERNRERRREIGRKTYEQNREKWYARNLVHKAIAAGKLMKQPCEVCGLVQTEAHHDDYDKPLDVRWLCRKHHGEVHRRYA